MNKFSTLDGIEYQVDAFGVIHQLNPVPFKYDENYCATYDTPEYKAQSDMLQALRLGFVIGAFGRVPFSLIDNGYGNGAFMKFAAQTVGMVMGKDITGVTVDGHEILCTADKTHANVQTFWDCLEHIPNLNFLQSLDTSLLCISLPHCHYHDKGLEWFNSWHHRKPNEHLHHFSDQSLKMFVEAYGWRMVAYSYHEDIVRKPRKGEAGKNIISMAFKRAML